MGCFGAPSPKRHMGWSNDEGFMKMIMARGGYLSSVDAAKLGTRLVKRKTKNGKDTFTGCSQLLKNSQCLCCSNF